MDRGKSNLLLNANVDQIAKRRSKVAHFTQNGCGQADLTEISFGPTFTRW